MKKYVALYLGFIGLFIAISCSDSNDIKEPPQNNGVVLNNKINNFVWKGMNSWYNWLPESANLADSKDDDQDEYYTFLNLYSEPSDLMYNLCYKHHSIVGPANAVDRFSWFIEDYEVQNNAFQGIRTRFGFTSQLIQINEAGDIIISVLMVEPGSPADEANMQRGSIINAIDGTVLNTSNINSVYGNLSNETVTLSFVTENNGVLTELDDKTITRALVTSNPVHFRKVFNDIGGKKVGYLVYNQFSDSFNDELNEAFAFFKAEGINELVLDLRFNPGGSGLATTYLGSMIYANAGNGTFYETKFNSKHSVYNSLDTFQDILVIQNTALEEVGQEPINRLNSVDRLYVLTSGSTASASELVINGLKPYMTDVKLIGTTTYGKNVGSVTLYDSPDSDFLSEEEANPAHKNAMQPICIQVFNKNGESDYTQGFAPDIEVDESNYWNAILPLGDRNEALLKVALDDISGIAAKQSLSKLQESAKLIELYLPENRFDNELYFNHIFKNKE
jgi:carboxyl-terminal processing protease